MPAIVLAWLLAATALNCPARASAPDLPGTTITAHVFWREGCPHCAKLRTFLEAQRAANVPFAVRYYEIGADRSARELLVRVSERLGADRVAVPFTVVGERWFVGYIDDASSGAELLAALAACRAQTCADLVASLAAGGARAGAARGPPATATPSLPAVLDLPILGSVRTSNLSLPLLTVALGALDGFNPCAMWTLVFLIGLLLGMRDRARMWILGGAFLVASSAVYFVFMAAWLNALLALGVVVWVRMGIGMLALTGGAWYLREFFVRRDDVCPVTAPAQRRRVFERLAAIAKQQHLWLALAAIVALAFAVNLVELVCSAGIPAVYTQVLALTPMPAWQHYGYIALYILVFMLDDLIVFAVAMVTLQAVGLTTRYARYSHLVGALVLMLIGAALLFRPQWLTFG